MSAQFTSPSREKILSTIRKALSAQRLPLPFPEVDRWDAEHSFIKEPTSNDELFAQNFVGLGGNYIYCADEQELLSNIVSLYDSKAWSLLFCAEEELLKTCQINKLDFVKPSNNLNDTADACITSCEALIARTGSFLISSRQHLGRVSPVFYPIHIVVAYKADVVYDINDGLELLKEKYKEHQPSMISLQTGPSRTADIEKTLVTGVHGPKEVFCFYVNV